MRFEVKVGLGVAAVAAAGLWLAFGGDDDEDGTPEKPQQNGFESDEEVPLKKPLRRAGDGVPAPAPAAGAGAPAPGVGAPAPATREKPSLSAIVASMDSDKYDGNTIAAAMRLASQYTNHGKLRAALLGLGVVEKLAALLNHEDQRLRMTAALLLANLCQDASAVESMVEQGVVGRLAFMVSPERVGDNLICVKAGLMLAKNMAVLPAAVTAMCDASLPSTMCELAKGVDADVRGGAIQVLVNFSCEDSVRPRLAVDVAPLFPFVAFDLVEAAPPMTYSLLKSLGQMLTNLLNHVDAKRLLSPPACVKAISSIVLALIDAAEPAQFFGKSADKDDARQIWASALTVLKDSSPEVAAQLAAMASAMSRTAAQRTSST